MRPASAMWVSRTAADAQGRRQRQQLAAGLTLDIRGPVAEVVAGQAKPLLRPAPPLCPEIHGDSGLDGPQGGHLLPRSRRAARPGGKAVLAMWEAISGRHAELGGRQKIKRV